MQALTPAVVLCDLCNMQRWESLSGGKDEMGNKRLFLVLRMIDNYMEQTLGLMQDNKWLIGDGSTHNFDELLMLFHDAGWRYVACPARKPFDGSPIIGNKQVPVSDDVLMSILSLHLRQLSPPQHFVMIGDDSDFLPDLEMCLEHGHHLYFRQGETTEVS